MHLQPLLLLPFAKPPPGQLTWPSDSHPFLISAYPISPILQDPAQISPVGQTFSTIPAGGDAFPLSTQVSFANTRNAICTFFSSCSSSSKPDCELFECRNFYYMVLNPLPINTCLLHINKHWVPNACM